MAGALVEIAVDIPELLAPRQLDRLLGRGWFRSGPLLYRTPILPIDHQLRQLVHVRLRLDAPLTKSRRRLLKRNRERFRVEIRRARLCNDRRRLYRRMHSRFLGFVMRDLDGLGITEPPFDTQEVAVFDGDKLVAAAWFDLGERATAGLIGMHDPAYAKFGLGIYTMLEEMEHARQHGSRWYYPGYVVPGVSAFDYKLTVAPAQFLRPDGRWRALARPPSDTPIADRAHDEMAALETALRAEGLRTERRLYPSMWLGWVEDKAAPYIRGMWHLRVETPSGPELIVEHLPTQQAYIATTVRHVRALDPFEDVLPDSALDRRYELRVLAYCTVLIHTRSLQRAVEQTAAFARRQGWDPA